MPTRSLAVAGPVAACVFVIGTVVATVTWPGYDHRVQPLSDLAGTAAPAPVIQNTTFVVFGAAVVALGVGLSARLGRPVAALVVGFGAAMAALSVLPCSPGCAAGTVTDAAHAIVAVLGFVAVALAMLLTWRRDVVGSARSGRASAVAGTVTLALLIAWLVAAEVDPVGWRAGLLQRPMVGTVLAWLVVVGWRLHRPPPPHDQVERFKHLHDLSGILHNGGGPLSVVDVGLPEPVAQRLLVDAELLSDTHQRAHAAARDPGGLGSPSAPHGHGLPGGTSSGLPWAPSSTGQSLHGTRNGSVGP